MWRLMSMCLWVTIWLLPAQGRAERHHKVSAGQTLSKLARRYRVEVHDLAAHNRLSAGGALRVGQVLQVPSRGVFYVRRGQTLSELAARHHCTQKALRRANGLREGEGLRAGRRLLLPGAVIPRSRDWGEPTEPGVVALQSRGETLLVRLLDEEGRLLRSGLALLEAAMVGPTDGGGRRVDPRLGLLISNISDHFGGRPLRIVSGFRRAGGYTKRSSRHVSGRAADIQVRGVPRRLVWEYCRRLSGTGCGLYPNSVFTHVDTRDTRAQWVDWSRPGRRPRYGTLRGPARKRGPRPVMGLPQLADETLPVVASVVEDLVDGVGTLRVAEIRNMPETEARLRVCLPEQAAWVPHVEGARAGFSAGLVGVRKADVAASFSLGEEMREMAGRASVSPSQVRGARRARSFAAELGAPAASR